MKYPAADLDETLYNPERQLDVRIIEELSKCEWIEQGKMNIPVRQHRKSGRRETVCPGLRKPLMRVYSRNVLSKP